MHIHPHSCDMHTHIQRERDTQTSDIMITAMCPPQLKLLKGMQQLSTTTAKTDTEQPRKN